MNDPIDRQTAIDALCELMHHWFGGDPKDEIREIKRELEKLPSAQPEPQRTGRWVQIKESIKVAQYRCSECGRTVCDDSGYDPYIDYPYCHCGARMEGEE